MNIFWTVIRSIIYKIPLKLLLILVAVFGILFACFSSADSFDIIWYNSCYISSTSSCSFSVWDCIFWSSSLSRAIFYDNSNNLVNFSFSSDHANSLLCSDFDWYFLLSWAGTYQVRVYEDLISICPSCPTCPEQFTSSECQTEYNLIPISSVDSAYCEENNLCSSSDCSTWDLTPWVSNIFINDIFHPWAFNVIMNIPEEIDRDYTYTNSWTNFNLDIVGYNQDEEYIQSVIDVQSYKPTSDDFTRVFSNISNFGALLIACLFVILVFYMIKKVFK